MFTHGSKGKAALVKEVRLLIYVKETDLLYKSDIH